MLDSLSRPVAVAEILVLLTLATLVGWLVSRFVLAGRIRALRTSMAGKQAEIADYWQAKALIQNTTSVELEPAEKQTLPTFIHADPLLPVVAPDETPAFIDADEPLSLVNAPLESPTEPALTTIPGNSETAILSRIAARANEVNFDRIGRAVASEADDLKDIIGVGPFLERKLHSLGIYTFRQIANFAKEDVNKVNEIIEFFPGRIERDNWVEQAREFSRGKAGDERYKTE